MVEIRLHGVILVNTAHLFQILIGVGWLEHFLNDRTVFTVSRARQRAGFLLKVARSFTVVARNSFASTPYTKSENTLVVTVWGMVIAINNNPRLSPGAV